MDTLFSSFWLPFFSLYRHTFDNDTLGDGHLSDGLLY